MVNLGRLSRSPPRHQPDDFLENDEGPLPIGWVRAVSNNVDRGRVYYTNGIQSQWNFPNPEGELQAEATHDRRLARIEAGQAEFGRQRRHARRLARLEAGRAEAEEADRLARIEAAQAEADRLARIEAGQAEFGRQRRHARRLARLLEAGRAEAEEADRLARIEAAQAEADRLVRIQLTQAGNDLLEILELITINNNFNERNMGILRVLTRIITEDNELPINRWNIRTYIDDLEILVIMLTDRNVHYNLKYLCEQIFEEIYEKLAKEKQMIDHGHISHNEIDTRYINEYLNMLNFIYIRFRNVISNLPIDGL